MKLYGLTASGILKVGGTPHDILCGRLFTKKGLAVDHKAEFRRGCTSSPTGERDLRNDGTLMLEIVEFVLVA